jgi:acetyltransferase-like isoleucine patch superfamily enzyme
MLRAESFEYSKSVFGTAFWKIPYLISYRRFCQAALMPRKSSQEKVTAVKGNPRIKKTASAIAVFRANPTAIALLVVARRSWSKAKSFVLGLLLRAPGLQLGPGSRIIGGKHISFGKAVYAERNLWLEAVTCYRSQRFDPHITIGDHVCFSDGVHISSVSSIVVGKHTLFGSRIYVSDHNHGIYKGQNQSSPDEPPACRLLGGGGPVVIGENVWIGDNAVIIGPANIGRGAVIAANSVVRGAIPSNTIVAGAPAKPIKIFNSKTGSWDKA